MSRFDERAWRTRHESRLKLANAELVEAVGRIEGARRRIRGASQLQQAKDAERDLGIALRSEREARLSLERLYRDEALLADA